MAGFAYDVPRVKAQVLRRVRGGESLCGICRAAAMPARVTLYKWAKADAAWAAALARARWRTRTQAAAAARRRPFDRAVADRLIVALSRDDGRSLEAVLAAEGTFPCRPTLRRWRREEAVFGRVVAKLLDWRRSRRAVRPVATAVRDAVGSRLAAGASFASLGRMAGEMPSRQTLRRWYARDPAFAAEVDGACEFRDWMLGEEIFAARERLIEMGASSWRELQAATAAVSRRRARLCHRPGTVHRKAGDDGDDGEIGGGSVLEFGDQGRAGSGSESWT